jgi:hypothetical protein
MSRQTRTGLDLVAVVNQNEHDRQAAQRFRNRLLKVNAAAHAATSCCDRRVDRAVDVCRAILDGGDAPGPAPEPSLGLG